MTLPADPLPPPASMSQLTDRQQATVGFQLYRGMADWAGQCKKQFGQLVDWINGETP